MISADDKTVRNPFDRRLSWMRKRGDYL